MNERPPDNSFAPPLSPQVLDQLVGLLVQAAHPRKIILFGSYARGQQTPDSDLDVIVILDKVGNRLDEMVRLRRALAPIKMPMDVLVYSEDDIRERGNWLGTALHEALQEGWVLLGE
jgi:uncharacterized protein